MLSWVFRNRAHLARVYAVAAEEAPLESAPIRPLRVPGQVLRLEDDVLLVPACPPQRVRALRRA